jgi:hypothetical protein
LIKLLKKKKKYTKFEALEGHNIYLYYLNS